ncbi:hypothetical protein BCAH1134_C0524 (plasmid) [Bacillus cereus AH1134]|nr:hypothetical protein BCAH1134_C0524 [Bacillus cereus AH1134]
MTPPTARIKEIIMLVKADFIMFSLPKKFYNKALVFTHMLSFIY